MTELVSGVVDDGREVKQLRVDSADLLPRRHLGALPNWDTNRYRVAKVHSNAPCSILNTVTMRN